MIVNAATAPASGKRSGRHMWFTSARNTNAAPMRMTAVSFDSAARPSETPAATSQRARAGRVEATARQISPAVAKNAIGPSSMIWRVTVTW